MSCITTPTATTTIERTEQSVFVATITTISTLPPTIETHTVVTSICTTNVTAATSSCTTSTGTELSTIPGGSTTVILTTETSTPVTNRVTSTLFTTSCTQRPDDPPQNPDTSTTSTSTTSSSSSSSSSTTTSLPPGVSTLTTTTTASPSPTTQGNNGNNQNSDSSNIGAIVGGAVGGFVGLALLALVTWYFLKKSSRFDNIFNKDDDDDHYGQTGRFEKKPGPNPGGYQYGPLEQEVAHDPFHANSPPSNAMQPVGGNLQETGFHPNANDTGYQPDHQHVRSSSLAPLLSGLGVAAAGATASSRPSTGGRPSTGSSSQHLLSQGQQQGYPQHGYPPVQQPISNTYNPAATAQGQSFGGFNPYAASGAESQGYAPSSMSHTMSTGSGGTSWGGQGSTSATSAYTPPIPVIAPVAGGALGAAAAARRQPDEETRSGSPVSIQERRVLQVVNPESSQSYDPYAAESSNAGASSSTAYTPPLSTSPSPPPASGPRVDGKGRPIRTRGEKAPIVHLDGGRYEEPVDRLEGTTAPPPGPSPPAYSPR